MWSLMAQNVTADDKKALADFFIEGDKFTNGANVKKFEQEFSEWLGVRHSVFVNSGASGNYLTIAALKDIKGGGEVIVPCLGWSSDVSSILQLGLKPILVDVEMGTLGLDWNLVEEAITKNTIGIVCIHVLGFNAWNEKISRIAQKHGLMVIEDCCEAHGALLPNGKKVGTAGEMSVFSFYYGHHITTIEGGMVCTNDDDIYDLLRCMRSHGMTRECSGNFQKSYKEKFSNLNEKFLFAKPGFNFRNTEAHALLGSRQLKRLDEIIEKRTQNLRCWLASIDDNCFYGDFAVVGSSNFALPLILKKPDINKFNRICECLNKLKCEYRVGTAGGGNLSLQPFVVNQVSPEDIYLNGNVDHIHNFGLYIGNNQHLNSADIKTVAGACNEA